MNFILLLLQYLMFAGSCVFILLGIMVNDSILIIIGFLSGLVSYTLYNHNNLNNGNYY